MKVTNVTYISWGVFDLQLTVPIILYQFFEKVVLKLMFINLLMLIPSIIVFLYIFQEFLDLFLIR